MGQKYILKYRKVKLKERSSTVVNVNSFRQKYLRHGASQGGTGGRFCRMGRSWVVEDGKTFLVGEAI